MMCKNATKVYLPENRNVLLTTAVWIFYAFVIAMREIDIERLEYRIVFFISVGVLQLYDDEIYLTILNI